MRTDATPDADAIPPRVLRRPLLRILTGSLLVSTAVVVAYFVLPLSSHLARDTFAELLLGLAALTVLLGWQIREILRSSYPAAQAVSALVMSVTVFLTLFAVTYYLMGDAQPGSFSEPMTRLDSMYFTVTVLATVGFGDITAVSQGARAVTTVQMVGGLVLVGIVARVIVGAVREGRSRRDEGRRS